MKKLLFLACLTLSVALNAQQAPLLRLPNDTILQTAYPASTYWYEWFFNSDTVVYKGGQDFVDFYPMMKIKGDSVVTGKKLRAGTFGTFGGGSGNSNVTANNFLYGYVSTVTSATPVTLTVSSKCYQYFTGSTAQTVNLPNTSTLSVGFPFVIDNNSTAAITINASDATTVTILAPGALCFLNCITIGSTTNTAWDVDNLGFINASGKSLTVNNSLTFTGTDGTSFAFPSTSKTVAASDGSNMVVPSQAVGDLIIGTATSHTRLADVAAGSPLISGGVTTNPSYASYLFSGTSGQTYTFPSTSKTLLANDGSNSALASQTTGDLIYASSATALGRIPDVAAGSPLISAGTSTIPAYATYLFSGTGSQTYTFPTTSKTLAANDGSNLTISGQAIGDIPVASSTTAYGKLAAVATGSLLASNGVGAAPQYVSTIPSSTLGNSTIYVGTTGIALNRASAALTLAGITLTTPNIGAATATTINNVTITQPASSATLTIANTGSLITSGAFAVQFTAAAASTMTVPSSTSATLNYYTSAPATANLLAYSGAASGLVSYVAAPSVLSGLQQTTNGSAPVWVTATGTGAPVNAVTPTFTGTPTGITWVQMPGSPTRVSATQFTCSGSLSTLLNYAAKGMIIKWTESATVRCAMIYSSSYGAPTTTINIVGDAMTSIDANSLMYCTMDAMQFAQKFVLAGTIGATGTDVANDWYAVEPCRVLALDMSVGTAGTTNSTSITMTNATGSVNLFGTVSLASTVAYSATPTNGNGASYYSLALGDRISMNVTAIQTTPAIDLYATMYVFPTRLLSIP